MARTMRDSAITSSVRGFVSDPLRLPFVRILQEVRHIGLSDAYSRLVTCGACALTVGQQEELYLQTIKGMHKADLDVVVRAFSQLVEDMETRPYVDLLGRVYMEIGNHLDKQRRGEFFTPFALSNLLARMQIGNDARSIFPTDRPLEASEPACGSGGMVLAFTEVLAEQGISPLHTRWTLQDLSPTSCYAAFINSTLWSIPAKIICGNTITGTEHWTWHNVLWHAAKPLPPLEAPVEGEEDRLSRLAALMQQFLTPPVSAEAAAPALTPTPLTPAPARFKNAVQPSLFE